MVNIIVVDNPKRWPLHIPGVPVVSAQKYLTDPHYSEQRNLKIFNLCRSYRYQSAGYYVSLLAMARGHKPLPNITNIQDMKSVTLARLVTDDLEELVQSSLKPIQSSTFQLSIYFGRNVAKRYDELSRRLFRLFEAPLMRAEFKREDDEWQLRRIGPIATNDIPESHKPFVITAALGFFALKRLPARRRSTTQYDLAILTNPNEATAPSDPPALHKFEAAAKRQGLDVDFIEREDFGRVGEFDALFIRETTSVHHHTYRFARRAVAEGLVVIDDPESIAKCSNKVYLCELLMRRNIPIPRTLIVHEDNRDQVRPAIGLPCILKEPDSSFSKGVVKVDDEAQLREVLDRLLTSSDLVIAQEFVPTEYDWRIGVLDRRPLFACRYYMVKKHWQIAQADATRTRYGKVEAVPTDLVPSFVIKTAVRASNLIGDGLYGVDIKQVGRKALVIEINDNPNIESDEEDRILGSDLYDSVMRVFLTRIHQKKNGALGRRA